MRLIFGIFPLLAIPVLIYNIMMGFGDGGLITTIMSVPMVSGGQWEVHSGDILVIIALVFFFAEILKATSTGTASIANHAVSMILFIICLIEFLLLDRFATSTFFILTIMCLLDVLAGVVVTIISARRDFTVSDNVPH